MVYDEECWRRKTIYRRWLWILSRKFVICFTKFEFVILTSFEFVFYSTGSRCEFVTINDHSKVRSITDIQLTNSFSSFWECGSIPGVWFSEFLLFLSNRGAKPGREVFYGSPDRCLNTCFRGFRCYDSKVEHFKRKSLSLLLFSSHHTENWLKEITDEVSTT